MSIPTTVAALNSTEKTYPGTTISSDIQLKGLIWAALGVSTASAAGAILVNPSTKEITSVDIGSVLAEARAILNNTTPAAPVATSVITAASHLTLLDISSLQNGDVILITAPTTARVLKGIPDKPTADSWGIGKDEITDLIFLITRHTAGTRTMGLFVNDTNALLHGAHVYSTAVDPAAPTTNEVLAEISSTGFLTAETASKFFISSQSNTVAFQKGIDWVVFFF